MTTPRVAVFVTTLQGGGAERATVTLLRGLAARGLSLDLILARAEGPYLDLVPDAVRVVDLRARRMTRAVRPLIRYLSHERPAALLTMLTHANVVGVVAAGLASPRPRVVVREGSLVVRTAEDAGTIRARLLPHLVRWIYPRADLVLANGAGVAADLRARLGIPERKLRVVPNPLDRDRLRAGASAPSPHPWLDDDGPPVVVAAGRLAPEKDVATLIRAIACLRASRPVRLIVVGEGGERARLEGLVRELGLGDAVALPGFDLNPYAWMARARVFVLSSRLEGAPNVLIEAMALGVPVASTDCPSGPAELLAGGLGPLSPIGDAARLAESIATCLDRPVAAESLRQRVESHDLERVVDAYLDALGIAPPSPIASRAAEEPARVTAPTAAAAPGPDARS